MSDTPHPVRCVPFDQLDRRSIIGASDVAAILGMSRWHTPLDLYFTKVADEPHHLGADQATTGWAKMGHRLEGLIREMYAQDVLGVGTKSGLDLGLCLVPGGHIGTVVRTDVPWMACSPDAIITKLPQMVGGSWLWGMDCKNVDRTQAGKWGEPGTDEVPDDYALQAQWCMHVTGLDRWDIAALIGGNDLRYYTLKRDERLMEAVLPIVEHFRGMVLMRVPPEATAPDNETIGKRIRQGKPDLLEDPELIRELIPELAAARAAFTEAEERKDVVEAQVKLAIGTAAGAQGPWGQVTWKAAKDGETTDWKAVASGLYKCLVEPLGTAAAYEVMDQLVAQSTTVKPGSRRFLVKLSDAVEVPSV